MDGNRIHLELATTRSEMENRDRIDLDAGFEIPIESRTRPLAVTGIIVHIVGVVLFTATALYAIIVGPDAWFAWDGDVAAAQQFKRFAFIAGLLGATFLLAGLALYTFGRTVRGGGEDLEVSEHA